MFYADFVLSKKGPLARIWLAAHWDRKITKSQVFETNIEKSVDGILQPSIKMALRTSGHLLLGVVRIYSRKAKYLLADCNEAFVKIKMAFRPGVVDLPEDHRETAVSAVTLPEVFHDFDNAMPDFKYVWNDVDIEVQFSVNQSRVDEITMREDFGSVGQLGNEYRFDDASFDTGNSEILRDTSQFNQSLNQANLLLAENAGDLMQTSVMQSKKTNDNIVENDIHHDEFSNNLEVTDGGIFQGGLFDDTPMPDVPMVEGDTFNMHNEQDEQMEIEHAVHSVSKPSPRPEMPQSHSPLPSAVAHDNADDDDDDDDDHFIPLSPGACSSDGSRPTTPVVTNQNDDQNKAIVEDENKALSPVRVPEEPLLLSPAAKDEDRPPVEEPERRAEDLNNVEGVNDNAEQITLIHNEDGSSYALEVLDGRISKGMSKPKRKRKLIVDEIKNINGDEMKAQLNDTSDIVTTLDLAPPTKRLMRWKETGGVEKLFALPGKQIPARHLSKNYQRFLTSKTTTSREDGQRVEQQEALNTKENIPPTLDLLGDNTEGVDHIRAHEQPIAIQTRRGRKRKIQPEDEGQKDKEQQGEHIPSKRAAVSTNALSPRNAALISNTSDGAFDNVNLALPLEVSSRIAAESEQLAPENRSEQHDKQLAAVSDPTEQPQPMDIVMGNEIAAAQLMTVEENLAALQIPVENADESVVVASAIPAAAISISSTPVPLQFVPQIKSPTSAIRQNDENDDLGLMVMDVITTQSNDKKSEDNNLTGQLSTDEHHVGSEANILPSAPPSNDDSNVAMANDVTEELIISNRTEKMPDQLEHLQPFSPIQPLTNDGENFGYDLQNQIADAENNVYCEDGGAGFNASMAGGVPAGGSTPWHDDYECPPSVPQFGEQADNETTEEFEERVLNKRANYLYQSIRSIVSEQSETVFSSLVRRNTRKQVAQKFYSLLVLKKFKVLELEQDEPYGEISLRPGSNFNDPKL